MDFMLALNVTIYGLGIVFLALLVLMVAIMILGKLFSVATGKDLLRVVPETAPAVEPPRASPPVPVSPPVSAPAQAAPEAAEPVNAPLPGKILSVAVKVGDRVRQGDELCVIEAMKMGNSVKAPRDGYVVDVRIAQGNAVAFGAPLVFLASTATAGLAAPAARAAMPAAAAPQPAAFTLGVAGQTHAVELLPAATGAVTVLLNGARHEVRRDAGDRSKLIVNGVAHAVEIKEIAGSAATVVIDGFTHKLELGRSAPAATRAFRFTSGGKSYAVDVTGGDGAAAVTLDGTMYRVERNKTDPGLILVNGQTHAVAVKERTGNTVTVTIDGRTERIEIAEETAPAPAAAAGAPARAAIPAPGGGTSVNAPLPGKILSVAVKAGDRVRQGDELCVIEAMKMGNSVKAPRDGVVREIPVTPGQTVAFGAPLVVLA